MSDLTARLLELVASDEGLSVARACKRLGVSRSELQRALVDLGPASGVAGLGGLDLVRVQREGERQTLWLTAQAARVAGATPLIEHVASKLDGQGSDAVVEMLAEELPVALIYNGVPHVVMMATPIDLEDFAVGFSLSEEIVATIDEVEVVDVLRRDAGIAIHLLIPPERFAALASRRRNLVGRSGCGLCGAEALESAVTPVRRVDLGRVLARTRLSEAFSILQQLQPLNARCGSLHAAAALLATGPEDVGAARRVSGASAAADRRVEHSAALFQQVGEGITATHCVDATVALLVREDVGRHNALDKVIGALARSGDRASALLVTSRASYELVHKAAAAGVPILASVSAPTAYAVRLALEAGVTLAAFVRDERMTVYAHPARILPDQPDRSNPSL